MSKCLKRKFSFTQRAIKKTYGATSCKKVRRGSVSFTVCK
jgi:hypothetical protein